MTKKDSTQGIVSETIPELPGYIHERGLARQLGVHPKSMWRYRRWDVGPVATRIGRQIFYKLEDVSAWLERCRQPNGAVRGRRRRRIHVEDRNRNAFKGSKAPVAGRAGRRGKVS